MEELAESVNLSAFTFFDVIVVVLVVFSSIMAFKKGFVTEILSFVIWVGAITATLVGWKFAIDLTRDFIQPNWLADIVGVVVLFVGSFAILKIICNWLGDMARNGPAGFLDRSAGLAFGIGRGVLVVCALYLAYTYWFPFKSQPDWIKKAQLQPLVNYGTLMLAETAPEVLEKIKNSDEPQKIIERLRDQVPQSVDEAEETVDGYEDEARDQFEGLLEDEMADERDT